jgi:hypothetical protein
MEITESISITNSRYGTLPEKGSEAIETLMIITLFVVNALACAKMLSGYTVGITNVSFLGFRMLIALNEINKFSSEKMKEVARLVVTCLLPLILNILAIQGTMTGVTLGACYLSLLSLTVIQRARLKGYFH